MSTNDNYWVHNPIKVKGGLRLDEENLSQWWAQRYLEALDEFSIGHRQVRGKRYAEQGQVERLTIEKGLVRASVQGTKRDPYSVQIKVRCFSVEEWARVCTVLSTDVSVISRILAGNMPIDLPHLFAQAGVALLPGTAQELSTDCSCADPSSPCKHTSAVHYLLAQELGRDPFLLLELRGLSREEFLVRLGLRGNEAPEQPESMAEGRPLRASNFWQVQQAELPELPPMEGSLISRTALLKQLGPFPMWRGQRALYGELRAAYQRAQQKAVDILTGAESKPN